MWLFRLPLFRNTRYRAARNSAVDFLRRRLAGAAGDRHHPRAGPRRTSRATSCSARVVSSTSISSGAGPPHLPRARPAPRPPPRPPRRAPSASATNSMAVEPLAADRDEQVARRERPRVDRHRADRAAAASPADHPPAGRGARPRAAVSASGVHAATTPSCRARRRASAARATSTSSNGSTLVADDLVLLVPLAGDQHQVARPRVAGSPARWPPRRSTIASDGVDAGGGCPLRRRDRPA